MCKAQTLPAKRIKGPINTLGKQFKQLYDTQLTAKFHRKLYEKGGKREKHFWNGKNTEKNDKINFFRRSTTAYLITSAMWRMNNEQVNIQHLYALWESMFFSSNLRTYGALVSYISANAEPTWIKCCICSCSLLSNDRASSKKVM